MSDDTPKPITVPEGVESVLPDDAPRITLPLFEGPLDLLLYLIRRDQIDIHDIPIAPITRRYMEYLELMQQLNLDVAGEFMVMAATLIHIKSKMLVPIEPTEAQGDEEAVDPREELVRRLLEFLELFASLNTKGEMIVTFLALLELVRLKHVRVYQRGMFGAIRVFRPVGPPEDAPAPV